MQLLVLAALSLVLMFLFAILSAFMGVYTPPVEWNRYLSFLAVNQLLVFGLPSVIVAALYYRDDMRGYLRLDFSGRRWLLALAGVVVLLLLVPLTDWLSVWNDGWHWSGAWERVEMELRKIGAESQTTVDNCLRECHPLLSLLCMALVPALCEELFFRAGIQNLLQRWFKNVHVAVWVTAALFSLAHGEVFAFLPRFLLGALLGYLYVGGGSLAVNVLAHFVNNAIVVLLYMLAPPESGFDPAAPLAIGWAVTLACSLAAVLLMVSTFGKGLKISK